MEYLSKVDASRNNLHEIKLTFFPDIKFLPFAIK